MGDDSADRNAQEEALRHAAMNGTLEEVTRLIAAGTHVDATEEYEGMTALMWAAFCGRMKTVRVLLAAGADINLQDKGGKTALMKVACKCHMRTVRVLLAAGADIDLQDKQGGTALMWAACYGRMETVRVLLAAGADTDLQDRDGKTVLMEAACNGHIDIVRVLLAAGADTNLLDKHGKTALIWAACYGRIETVRVLLAAGADIDLQDKSGWTALMFAAGKNNASLQEAIVDAHLAHIRAAMHESISSVPSADHQRQPQQPAIQPNLRWSLVMTDLPEDIYRCIQAFTPINALLNTSRRLADVKRRLHYWNLTRHYSLLYYLSAEYRVIFASNGRLLHDSRKQVGLDLRLRTGSLSEDVVNELRGATAVLRIHLPT